MKKIINLYKPLGLTPLQATKIFQKDHPEYKDKKIGYAGRLDPMAEGVLILLVGNENKKAKEYQKLDKDYVFEVIFGLQTDTHDLLGLVSEKSYKTRAEVRKSRLEEVILSFKGKIKQKYPAYSSYKVKGKPLFYWAREGRLSEIEIPKRKVEIKSFKLTGSYLLGKDKLFKIILQRVNLVKGDFRQEKICKAWKKYFKNSNKNNFQVFQFQLSCSSGTYVRALVNDLGKILKSGALTLNIKRTRVGDYPVKDSLRLSLTETIEKMYNIYFV